MSNCSASCTSVRSPLIAAIATFALKADVWFRRGLLLMLSPDSRANLARWQAEAPLIALCRFPKPALPALSSSAPPARSRGIGRAAPRRRLAGPSPAAGWCDRRRRSPRRRCRRSGLAARGRRRGSRKSPHRARRRGSSRAAPSPSAADRTARACRRRRAALATIPASPLARRRRRWRRAAPPRPPARVSSPPSSFFRIRGAVLHLGPMGERGDVLEGLEVDAFVLARGPAGLEVGERVLDRRSEEHTSELQSLRHLVCRLLLEKK